MVEIKLEDAEKDAVLRTVLDFVLDLDKGLEVTKPNSYMFFMMGYTVKMSYENIMILTKDGGIVHMTAFTEYQKQTMSQIFKILERNFLEQDKKINRKRYFLAGLGLS